MPLAAPPSTAGRFYASFQYGIKGGFLLFSLCRLMSSLLLPCAVLSAHRVCFSARHAELQQWKKVVMPLGEVSSRVVGKIEHEP